MATKRKRAKGRRAKVGTFGEAVKALKGARVPHKEFGQFNNDGTVKIDPRKLDRLKQRLGVAAGRTVRFVALNAPFKRRSPSPPA
jgi:hypothetical protein